MGFEVDLCMDGFVYEWMVLCMDGIINNVYMHTDDKSHVASDIYSYKCIYIYIYII
jgi:hypothetical protein